MIPLIVLISSWLALWVAGRVGILAAAATWNGALRYALAAMFAFTAMSHFLPRTRPDLVRMVPPGLPNAPMLVTITGLFELAGACGLLIPATARQSAWALIALLAALFPANVYAARSRLSIAGRPATPLVFRLPLQLFWMAALWYAARA